MIRMAFCFLFPFSFFFFCQGLQIGIALDLFRILAISFWHRPVDDVSSLYTIPGTVGV